MKLFLSYSEAQSAVRNMMNLGSNVEIVIGRKQDDKSSTEEPVLDFSNCNSATRALVNFVDTHPNEKIQSIKEVRAVTGMGLKEAKDCVENWKACRAFIAERGFFPGISYNNGVVTFY